MAGWLKLAARSFAVAVLAAAAQLGLASALALLAWNAVPTADVWRRQVTWVVFIFAAAVLAGVAGGNGSVRSVRQTIANQRADAAAARHTGVRLHDPSSRAGRQRAMANARYRTVDTAMGIAAGASRVGATAFASLGALAAFVLVWFPAHNTYASADLWVLFTAAGLGIGVGAIVSLLSLLAAPIAANAAVWVAGVWIFGLASVVMAISTGVKVVTPRLGVLDAPHLIGPDEWWLGPFLMLVVAAIFGSVVAAAARWTGAHRLGTALSGLAGPAMVAAAYLRVGPNHGLTSSYVAALLAVTAGLLTSAATAVASRSEVPVVAPPVRSAPPAITPRATPPAPRAAIEAVAAPASPATATTTFAAVPAYRPAAPHPAVPQPAAHQPAPMPPRPAPPTPSAYPAPQPAAHYPAATQHPAAAQYSANAYPMNQYPTLPGWGETVRQPAPPPPPAPPTPAPPAPAPRAAAAVPPPVTPPAPRPAPTPRATPSPMPPPAPAPRVTPVPPTPMPPTPMPPAPAPLTPLVTPPAVAPPVAPTVAPTVAPRVVPTPLVGEPLAPPRVGPAQPVRATVSVPEPPLPSPGQARSAAPTGAQGRADKTVRVPDAAPRTPRADPTRVEPQRRGAVPTDPEFPRTTRPAEVISVQPNRRPRDAEPEPMPKGWRARRRALKLAAERAEQEARRTEQLQRDAESMGKREREHVAWVQRLVNMPDNPTLTNPKDL